MLSNGIIGTNYIDITRKSELKQEAKNWTINGKYNMAVCTAVQYTSCCRPTVQQSIGTTRVSGSIPTVAAIFSLYFYFTFNTFKLR